MNTATLQAPPGSSAPPVILSDYELERGKPMPSKNHGIIQARLIVQLDKSQEYQPISEFTLELIPGRPMTPDISICPREPMDLWHDEVRGVLPPVSAIEIVSMSQSSDEMRRKVRDYLDHGVKSCWLVDPPMQEITVFTADGKKKTFEQGIVTDPVTGLTVDLDAVFA